MRQRQSCSRLPGCFHDLLVINVILHIMTTAGPKTFVKVQIKKHLMLADIKQISIGFLDPKLNSTVPATGEKRVVEER